MGLSFTIVPGPRQLSHSEVGFYDHILLSHILDSHSLEGQVPIFRSPRNRLTQLHPQALGSLFSASYDSQDYCGGIRPRFHTGWESVSLSCLRSSLYSLGAAHTENTTSNSAPVFVFIDPFLRNGFFYCWWLCVYLTVA
jgi:hypothetical protein